VGTHVLVVVVAGFGGRTLGSALHNIADKSAVIHWKRYSGAVSSIGMSLSTMFSPAILNRSRSTFNSGLNVSLGD
jgi:hypothetical protein